MKTVIFPSRISIMYGFVRGRQLEGTFPGEPSTGVWPITALRVGFGWGSLPEELWPKSRGQWPPPEPPTADSEAKKFRAGRYQRVRTLDDCKRVMGNVRPFPVLASFEITDKWRDAPSGTIPTAAPNDVSLGNHTVLLVGYDDSRAEFTFQNSWGEDWGDGGYGTIGYETFEATCWEAWVWDFIGARDATPQTRVGFKRGDWGLRDHAGGMFHCREFIDPDDERIAWAFAIERAEALEIEELFVRPRFRRNGYGKRLTKWMRELAVNKQLPLRIWIPDVDAAHSNLRVLDKLIEPLGLRIVDSNSRWAPLMAQAA
jgi:GNAT superfamily N-acetyltransferase